jgi:hypothetical protein
MATLKEFAEYIKNTYPRTKKMFNGKRCDNKLTVDGILYELEEFEKKFAMDKPSSVLQANELLPHVNDSLPFDEYHKFHEWMGDKGWYEVAPGEYDNLTDPNSCIRLDIKELYIEYKRLK